jgi:hypothetical protein
MASFFSRLLAPFKSSHAAEEDTRRSSAPGPYSTGTSIEAQTPARRRGFWRGASAKWSGSATPDVLSSKGEKAPRADKMGTINGVFIPTTLNVMSILMYLRVSAGRFETYGSTGSFLDRVEW